MESNIISQTVALTGSIVGRRCAHVGKWQPSMSLPWATRIKPKKGKLDDTMGNLKILRNKGRIHIFLEIGAICNTHHWPKGMDAPGHEIQIIRIRNENKTAKGRHLGNRTIAHTLNNGNRCRNVTVQTFLLIKNVRTRVGP